MTSMWNEAIFVGVKLKTGEFSVSDKTGVWKTRTLKRKPIEERWASAEAEMLLGVPWNVQDKDPKADGAPPW